MAILHELRHRNPNQTTGNKTCSLRLALKYTRLDFNVGDGGVIQTKPPSDSYADTSNSMVTAVLGEKQHLPEWLPHISIMRPHQNCSFPYSYANTNSEWEGK